MFIIKIMLFIQCKSMRKITEILYVVIKQQTVLRGSIIFPVTQTTFRFDGSPATKKSY